jgi:predicted RNA methylase
MRSMNRKFKDALGQHMTPRSVAGLFGSEVFVTPTAVIDLAVGDGALLAAAQCVHPGAVLCGIDCDPARLEQAAKAVEGARLRLGDGLSCNFPRLSKMEQQRVLVVGNPPFLFSQRTEVDADWQTRAFPGVDSKHGIRRTEMSFFSRALVEAKKRKGLVAILMPSPFASGILYTPYRQSLLRDFNLLKVINIEDARYRDTEASTVLLVVDTASTGTSDIEISRFCAAEATKQVIYAGPIGEVDRLDAGYWSAINLHRSKVPTLGDVGVDVARGRFCKADAERVQRRVLHTTDLSKHTGATIRLSGAFDSDVDGYDITARAGDILLARTGTRVRWDPIMVTSGSAPITDHILRIRAPKNMRTQVAASFMHPNFATWLSSVSKGVCATVITKRELLRMPLFASSQAC